MTLERMIGQLLCQKASGDHHYRCNKEKYLSISSDGEVIIKTHDHELNEYRLNISKINKHDLFPQCIHKIYQIHFSGGPGQGGIKPSKIFLIYEIISQVPLVNKHMFPLSALGFVAG